MKYFALVLTCLLVGCEEGSYETRPPSVPAGLSDCSFFKLKTSQLYRSSIVIRCPNSSTTVKTFNSKTSDESITIDGSNYQKVD